MKWPWRAASRAAMVSREPVRKTNTTPRPRRAISARYERFRAGQGTIPLAPASRGPSTQSALPRFPQPYADRIVFVADGNLWSVPRAGGTAERLTSAPGQDLFPRVSPDAKWIAYTEAGNAGTDVWVIPAAGGSARRLSF